MNPPNAAMPPNAAKHHNAAKPPNAAKKRKGRDLLMLVVALLLLGISAAGWLISQSQAQKRREETLATVPSFPSRGQVAHRRPAAPHAQPAPAPPNPVAAPAPAGPPKRDRLNAFALALDSNVAVVQVNALFNTPLFERFRECAPVEFQTMEKDARELGVDLERDIDRAAMVPGGMAVSGFFEGKNVAETVARRNGGEPAQHEYRGQTVWQSGSGRGGCITQMGNLMVMGPADGCEKLVDRALDSQPTEDAEQQVYGDVFVKNNLQSLRDRTVGAQGLSDGERDAYGALLDSLSGVTLRANVWDQVALSVDGDPKNEKELRSLLRMSRGAIALAKTQLGDDQVELQTLADLAKVSDEGGKLHVDMALPAADLFDKLHIPCPGKQAPESRPDAGQTR